MTSLRDPQTCRRALREIGEIAAVAGLEDSRMSGIWVFAVRPPAPPVTLCWLFRKI